MLFIASVFRFMEERAPSMLAVLLLIFILSLISGVPFNPALTILVIAGFFLLAGVAFNLYHGGESWLFASRTGSILIVTVLGVLTLWGLRYVPWS